MFSRKARALDAEILDQAVDWLLLMDEKPLNNEQLQEFEQWKNTSPLHQEIWQRVEKVQNNLKGHTQYISHELAENILNNPQLSTPIIGKIILVFTVGSLLSGLLYIGQQQAWMADYRTAYAEQKQIRLDDGTLVVLNSKSAIDIQYTKSERNIILRFGEIYIETAKDKQHRPFKVLGKHGDMLALGTAFNVNQQSQKTILSVTQHSVEITTKHSRQPQLVKEGQQSSFNTKQIFAVEKMQFEPLVWRHGLVTVNRINVEDLAKIIERHYGISVEIDPAASNLKHIEFSGSFPINNLDRLFVLLQETYPLRIEQSFFNTKILIKNTKI